MPGNYSKTQEALARLTSEQFAVTQLAATEPPFQNEYWDRHDVGLYVDIVSGEPLFASIDKFDSSSGWPSFTVPISSENIVLGEGSVVEGIEVRSAHGDSHLGHLFDDGPEDKGGLRFCINSAALRFIPVDELESQGYSAYRQFFTQ